MICDTNVLVSGVLFGGHARGILRLASRGVVVNFISPDILREAENVLSRSKFDLRPEQVLEIIALFKDTFEIVIPSIRVRAISTDPEDNHVIEAAQAARAKYIISGDKHLLELKKWEDIQIVSPAHFMQTVIGQQSA
ncbi:MAG: putative toxin-antitoxin system toxin component, PIN family [Deltaproteobacteria bacterium]|nr:putative toxin-antitoxin system toxin component, PIN family [Deltaproteobacteria bacterium]